MQRFGRALVLALAIFTLTGPTASAAMPPGAGGAGARFEDWSDGATLRLDYHHSGLRDEEAFALDLLRREGPWPGSRNHLIDPLNLGPYRFEVRDAATSRVLFAQGFSSIFSEWVTTGEAKKMRRSFHESLRFPFPSVPIQVAVLKRGADNLFGEVASFAVDPGSLDIIREPPTGTGKVWPVFENGPSEEKVDLLILGDGYTQAELPTFRAEARRLVKILFETPPFRERRKDFNVWAIDRASEDSGVDRPRAGVYRRTALNVTYNIFGSERYALTLDNRTLRETASQAPYEFIEILINGEQYGRGGIYNLFATCVTRSGSSPYVFVHEFGHHFAALADEYYTSSVAYDTTTPIIEPWEPNITALLDPASLKWKDLVDRATPLPTPWAKGKYESRQTEIQERRRALRAKHAPEEKLNALFAEELDWTRPFLAGQKHAGKSGAFEGAGYRARGLYRSSTDCLMFTRNPDRFCPVCSRAIERVIDWVAGR
ncbi:MAG: M64 family metallopeptidase [Acidobacteriota bacterium]